MPIDTNVTALNLDDYKYGFKDPDNYVFKSEKGLSRKVVEMISSMKGEPEWMLKFRLRALEIYEKKPVPTWGADLSGLNMDEIYFYVKPSEKEGRSWDDVEVPLQAYFRVNSEKLGQFERTLIIADEGAKLHYIEGCTAPTYSSDSFHSGVIEIVVRPGANVRYTTIQNWSNNMYNLVTQRAKVHRDARMAWLDGNLGSKVTMKYPSCFLVEPGASGEIMSIAYAGSGQHQDAGGKMVHAAPHTTSEIVSKSISKGGGRSSYRGLVKVEKGAHHARSNVECDALLLDPEARTDTYPYIEIDENDATIGHEATVSKIGDEQLFYLMQRGLAEAEARTMIVRGFIEPISKHLPLEYAVELNRLVELE